MFRDKVAPWLLFVLGVLLGLKLYDFNEFQLNVFNIGAFFLTLTGLNLGSSSSPKNNFILKFIKKVNISIGIFMIILAAFASGFKYYDILLRFVNNINTNALLLIGIAVTLWSFKLSDERQNILVDKKEEENFRFREKYLAERELRIKFQEELNKFKKNN
ncbi:hypothetical protein NKT34_18215 [Paenibacillus polysaccharolyticus]|uniref:hypothetical protein n=1 Tax=Paenibacillus polysaccharolyticus TaxID=582692 RepID=UPI00209EF9DA|nr:hypothetical protein [Paenibacillus polysaccharolyticus]MCP1135238.1 hypothetical protein [Paenibacillus polysaccharolyticus]